MKGIIIVAVLITVAILTVSYFVKAKKKDSGNTHRCSCGCEECGSKKSE